MNTITETRTAGGGVSTPAVGGAQALGERFLALLVAQLKHQNPLHPLDNAQITSQLAQLNTVSGIERLNATLASLAAGLSALQRIEAAGLIGRTALVPGETLALAAEEVRFAAELAQPADSFVVTIEDATGRAVHARELGPQPAGVVLLAWDGRGDDGTRLPAGVYRFRTTARAAGQTLAATPLVAARISAAGAGPDGATIVLEDGRTTGLASVRRIF